MVGFAHPIPQSFTHLFHGRDNPFGRGILRAAHTSFDDSAVRKDQMLAVQRSAFSRMRACTISAGSIFLSNAFENLVFMVIAWNALMLMAQHFGEPQWLTLTRNYTTFGSAGLFFVEAAGKMVALGVKGYYYDWWNRCACLPVYVRARVRARVSECVSACVHVCVCLPCSGKVYFTRILYH